MSSAPNGGRRRATRQGWVPARPSSHSGGWCTAAGQQHFAFSLVSRRISLSLSLSYHIGTVLYPSHGPSVAFVFRSRSRSLSWTWPGMLRTSGRYTVACVIFALGPFVDRDARRRCRRRAFGWPGAVRVPMYASVCAPLQCLLIRCAMIRNRRRYHAYRTAYRLPRRGTGYARRPPSHALGNGGDATDRPRCASVRRVQTTPRVSRTACSTVCLHES